MVSGNWAPASPTARRGEAGPHARERWLLRRADAAVAADVRTSPGHIAAVEERAEVVVDERVAPPPAPEVLHTERRQ